MADKPTAVVIGLDCMTGLQTTRIFTRRGVPVVALADDLTHYCARTRLPERIIAADLKTDALIDELEKLGPSLAQPAGQKAVLVPCTDMSVLLISRNRVRLQDWYYIGLPAKEVVETLIDKYAFYTYAAQANLPIPETHFLRSRADAVKAAGRLQYPCILKPPMKSQKWERNTSKKVIKLSSREEFLNTYEQCAGWADLLMVQEWIEGTDENLYSCNCYFNNQNQPLVSFIARKIRQWPPETGTSCLGEEVRNDEVLEASLSLFEGIGYHGLGYVEMKRDQRTGKHYIIEPNIGRPTGRSAIAEFSGVELLYTKYCDLTGLPLPPNRQQKYQGTKWIHLRRDLQSAFYYWRKGELTLKGWLKSVWGIRQDAIFAWNDPVPFLADFLDSAGTLFSGRKRRKKAANPAVIQAGTGETANSETKAGL